jgi:hypothetical protein
MKKHGTCEVPPPAEYGDETALTANDHQPGDGREDP